MKIQDLAIIFVVIIVPISLILSVFTQFEMKTINTQALYDAKLTSATYDAIKAFQLNSANSTTSDLANSKLRDLEASIVTFRNSLKSSFSLTGYTEEELNNYIPALVYTLYDGFYIYSPYENVNHRYETKKDEENPNGIKDPYTGEFEYETDSAGEKIPIDENGEKLYGLKPYIAYSCRYKGQPSINDDFVITYSLDNYISIRGIVNGNYVNTEGYLIEDIIEQNGNVTYKGITIEEENNLYEDLPLGTNSSGDIEYKKYRYIKLNGIKYYLNEDDSDESKHFIFSMLNGKIQVQWYNDPTKSDDKYDQYKELMENNNLAKSYYKEAAQFTDEVKSLRIRRIEIFRCI